MTLPCSPYAAGAAATGTVSGTSQAPLNYIESALGMSQVTGYTFDWSEYSGFHAGNKLSRVTGPPAPGTGPLLAQAIECLAGKAGRMAGAAPVTMTQWGVDALVCSGYKWLSAPSGVALLAITENLAAATPVIVGWKGSATPFDFTPQELSLWPLTPAGSSCRSCPTAPPWACSRRSSCSPASG